MKNIVDVLEIAGGLLIGGFGVGGLRALQGAQRESSDTEGVGGP